ncbi:hypothetical protein Aph02nite_25760 [Actinoplanes philippinensis]|uniref:Uncharacterized protein n=1 Tax=Actinoplanes philippinensis TaxID=35752 RepID=A0A1I2G7Y5_9ACTN|nr:hypothetical protein [Actinoplanes philippinensis]GIE76626.1 hypothetical protein Aph02nite_25760 [Actinoplanes philippinensis]SFF12731.1 hypothetical protein SAMN05421541_106234 [Actinoplanes philippinensis]
MSDLKTYIQNVLEANHADNERIDERIEQLESEGHRIVDGGQIGETAWDIVDWRTNEILAAGDDGLDGFVAAGQELDPDDKWIHYDRVVEDVELTEVDTDLPDGLAAVVEDWALSGDTEEIAGFIGWTAEKVERYQDAR